MLLHSILPSIRIALLPIRHWIESGVQHAIETLQFFADTYVVNYPPTH